MDNPELKPDCDICGKAHRYHAPMGGLYMCPVAAVCYRPKASTPKSNPGELEAVAILREALFLLQMLDKLDWSGSKEDIERDFHGHVTPSIKAIASLLNALSSIRPGGDSEPVEDPIFLDAAVTCAGNLYLSQPTGEGSTSRVILSPEGALDLAAKITAAYGSPAPWGGDKLKEALEGLLPTKLCGESWGLPDSESVTIVTTFGKLKAARLALSGEGGGDG